MIYERNKLISDIVLITPKIWKDDRGYFFESFRDNEFKDNVANIEFIQENESKSSYGVLRGLHYQTGEFSQSKLIRVISGKILDVVVDLRKNSATFGKYISNILSSKNKQSLFIPSGFAHGFVVLSKEVIFQYKVDKYYSPENESGIIWNDPQLNIDWKIPENDMIVSDKDQKLPEFKDAILFE